VNQQQVLLPEMDQQQQQQLQHGIELLLYDDPHSEYTAKVRE
jgi:hypothetical protein